MNSLGAPNGSVSQIICSSGKFLLAGRFGKNDMSLEGKCWGEKDKPGWDLVSRIAGMWYLSATSF